jgi:hypothetical protein
LQLGLPDDFTFNYPEVILTFVHIVSNAVVISCGDVFVDQTKLIIQRCIQSNTKPWPKNVEKLPLHDEVFAISQNWGGGYYHANVEDMIRISPYLDYLRENTQIKIHVQGLHSYVTAWLESLGISKSRLVTGYIRVTLLYMPAGTTCGRPTYLTSNLLSLNYRRKSPGVEEESPRDTVIVIKRSQKRYFRQHDKIWKMTKAVAKKYGFKVRLFSDIPHVPSVNETKEMFRRAVLILGPHGAGFSNMQLSPPGTIILEAMCNEMNLCFRNYAKVLGHRYVGLFGKKSCFDISADDLRPHLEFFLENIFVKPKLDL